MRKHEEILTAFAPKEDLNDRSRFFLVGIGGAGMSALARMLAHRGYAVRGTDSTASPETEKLQAEGIEVRIGHSGEGLTSEDALVVTDAIDLESSPEVARARELGIPMVRRSQALGWLLKNYKVIAVTGTHGKTTTTGMLGTGLIEAGADPLVVVGAGIPQFGGPVREGKGAWAVVEACEAYDSFHDLDPFIVVLTNLELDHADFHGSYENLEGSVLRFVNRVPRWQGEYYGDGDTLAQSVTRYLERVPEGGALVYCRVDPGAKQVAQKYESAKFGYDADTFAELSGGIREMALAGEHNRTNAAGALLAIMLTGANTVRAAQGIAAFTGADRRLQKILSEPFVVIDDYAHHPTEIRASLRAVRERYPSQRIIGVFQPHLYSRTADNIEGFADALDEADFVVLTDIYPAREAPMPGISSMRIAEGLSKPFRHVPSRHLLPRMLTEMAQPGDVVVVMGAGNIASVPLDIRHELRRPSQLRIAVVYGGDSAEREVSLHSGRAVFEALKRLGHLPFFLDISEILLTGQPLPDLHGRHRPDLAFLAVHGTNAEDGAVQGLFELLHIPYTGSGIQASALAMDKAMTKRVLTSHGIRLPQGVLITAPDQEIPFAPPLIVKPNAQGSTVGLSFVENRDQLRLALQRGFAYDSALLVEEWIRGIEISTPVLDGQALLPVEIAPASGRYDFASKYTPGATEEIVPARLPQDVLEEARRIAVLAHEALGCAGATRTDAIVRDGEIYVLEVNTLPGMTATSLLPNSAQAAGISFDDLVDRLVQDALRRHAAKT